MRLYLLLIALIVLTGCSNEVTVTNSTKELNYSCSLYNTQDGVYINSSTNINELNVHYYVEWIDSYDNGIKEKRIDFEKSYKGIISGTKKIDDLSVCLPKERKGKSDLFKCKAIIVTPCKSEHTFIVAYTYKNNTETFTSPPLQDYVTMYKTLRARFG